MSCNLVKPKNSEIQVEANQTDAEVVDGEFVGTTQLAVKVRWGSHYVSINLKNKILRHPIEIGKHKFTSKKEALMFYKTILNSYEFEVKTILWKCLRYLIRIQELKKK